MPDIFSTSDTVSNKVTVSNPYTAQVAQPITNLKKIKLVIDGEHVPTYSRLHIYVDNDVNSIYGFLLHNTSTEKLSTDKLIIESFDTIHGETIVYAKKA